MSVPCGPCSRRGLLWTPPPTAHVWRPVSLPPPQGSGQVGRELSQSIRLWDPVLQLLCPKASRGLLSIEESEGTPCQRSS